MNRYELRRWLGTVADAPPETYVEDTDRILSKLKTRYNENRGDADLLSLLISLAFRFSRLDSLSDLLGSDDWDNSPEALLQRGRLRFYQAMAENPASPDTSLLDKASEDFHAASASEKSGHEALAALVRLHAISDGKRSAMQHLRRLERIGGASVRTAAIGARLFLAGRPGISVHRGKLHLRKARNMLSRGLSGADDRLLLADIDVLLGRLKSAFRIRCNLADSGDSEALYILLRHRIDRLRKGDEAVSYEDCLQDLFAYRDARPSDPRAYIMEGDLLEDRDNEASRMAWRGALVLDDRHADAWGRLGDLYREAWSRGGDEHGDRWLEAAGDAYIKAVALAPLSPEYRISLGIVERESGRPARAVSTLKGALALVPDDTQARRWLAASWTDLATSPDLASQSRTAAAGKARSEWMGLIERGRRLPGDLMGLCRSLALESLEDPERFRESEDLFDSILKELLQTADKDSTDDLILLAEDFRKAGLDSKAALLLENISDYASGNPRFMALKASIISQGNPSEGIRLYLTAAGDTDLENPDWIGWMMAAAETSRLAGKPEGAVSILETALSQHSGNPELLRLLAENLALSGDIAKVGELYRDAMAVHPDDRVLLEDAVWFLRGMERPLDAEKLLEESLAGYPEDGRIWNQLGVHIMETGWDDSRGLMNSERLNEAIEAYRKAVEFQPENAVFRGNLGDALRQAGKWREASELLEAAIADAGEGPDSAFAENALARLEDERSYAAEGSEASADDWESSGHRYRAAVTGAPGNVDFQRDYAWWLYRDRRLDESISHYRMALDLDPEDSSLHYGESVCWRELGDETKALISLEKALALDPRDFIILADKADILGDGSNPGAAEILYKTIIDGTGGAPWAWERLASFRSRRAGEALDADVFPLLDGEGGLTDENWSFAAPGRNAESDYWFRLSIDAWREALSSSGEDRRISARLGETLMAVGEKAEAAEVLNSSLMHGPEDAPVLEALGRLALDEILEHGDSPVWEISLRYLEKAVEYMPRSSGHHAFLAYRYYLSGNYKKAFESFREAAERDPENPTHRAHAGISAQAAGISEVAVHFLHRALDSRQEAIWQNSLGLAYLASGSPDHALEAFRSACLTDPERELYTANLAMAHDSVHFPEGLVQ